MHLILAVSVIFLWLAPLPASGEELRLQDLIDEALRNNPEILASSSRVMASKYRIPQAGSLPDPMFMFGYQNEGFERYSYGEEDAMWMFSASQMVPFPGKLGLKEEMASRDWEGLAESHRGKRLKVVERVRELYYDLFLAYKTIDLIRDRTALFSKIEEAALARYASGMGVQQEVLMAQAEKYMLLEKEEMWGQKARSLEAMLNAALGRDGKTLLGRPAEPAATVFERSLDDLVTVHIDHSPFVKEKERMVAAAEAKVRMAQKEYYPDFTVSANYFSRGGEFEDMWSLTTSLNIPIFYKKKQRHAVLEAEAALSEARQEVEAIKVMLSASIRDSYAMLRSAERLMGLYKDGLIPKTYQDFESALAGYGTGKVEAITVINRLKALIDYEMLYWVQLSEREKAIARIESIAEILETGGEKR